MKEELSRENSKCKHPEKGRRGGKLRSEAIALGQVIKNLEGLLGDLHPLL